ncbi:hypothetical protein BDV10DRAFT_191112 [Aspergillus recurvatus]
MSYTRAEDVQTDVWELVGNEGWHWKSLFPYYKKSEDFEVPTQEQIAHEEGSLEVDWPTAMTSSSVFPILNETFEQLDIHYNRDSDGGKMVGFTVHPDTRTYYWPYDSRANLNIISNTQANKVIWANTTHREAIAIGVEEVIVSAGALRSPALLELSGVGNPDILRKYRIPVKVDLPTVGGNLQDQTKNALTWEGKDHLTGLATFSALPSVIQLYGNRVSADVSSASNGVVKESDLLAAFKLQYDLIFKSQGESFFSEYWPLLPFSRGSIHIQSANASQPPAINPNYFMFEQDAIAQADVAQFDRMSFPQNSSSTTWNNWVLANYRPNSHPVGTTSMFPRENGGVVSPELKVYGTKNVRVIDASVLRFQLCGHLQSTLYAVAEKASDLIKRSHTA